MLSKENFEDFERNFFNSININERLKANPKSKAFELESKLFTEEFIDEAGEDDDFVYDLDEIREINKANVKRFTGTIRLAKSGEKTGDKK